MLKRNEVPLEHLDRMTDSTGLIQHAIYSIPRRESGYTTDDNARALRLCTRLWGRQPDEHMLNRVTIYIGFLEFARRLGDFAIAGVACLLALDQSQSVVRSSISLIGIANAPVRVTVAEGLLKGSAVTERTIEAASAEASKIVANSDLFASGSYRQHLAGVLTKRALKLANERAGAAAQSIKSVPA